MNYQTMTLEDFRKRISSENDTNKITLYMIWYNGRILKEEPIPSQQALQITISSLPKEIGGYRRIEARNGTGASLEIKILSNHREPPEDRYSSLVY